MLSDLSSLLPAGITQVEGQFSRGDLVSVTDEAGLLLAHGLSFYDAEAIRRIAGHHSSEVEKILGWQHHDEIIHRDNLVMV